MPSRLLKYLDLPNDIQIIPFELNLRKEKWMFVCIYRPPSQNKQYFLEQLSQVLDHYSSIYDNFIILGDFNMEPSSSILLPFMQSYNLYNLIKSNTCFKGSGSCIDLILTNRKYCFKNSLTFETGLSDHHLLIYSMLRTTFKKEDSKRLVYRDYKKFSNDSFQVDLEQNLPNCNKNYESFENIFIKVLNRHAPIKTKFLRGNQKPHVDKNLRKAIMKRSKLKSKANRTKQIGDVANYKKQRNLVVKLNKKRKTEFFENLETSNDSKPFWNKCKPYFSNKHAHGNSKILLIEKEKIALDDNNVVEKEKLVVKNDDIATTFNKHFSETVEKLDIFEWPSCKTNENQGELATIVNKFKNHLSIIKIKSNYIVQEKFSFKPVSVKDIENIVKNIPKNKTAGGEIPLDIIKQSVFSYEMLKDCINYSILKGKFPDSLKLANITPVHKKDEPTDKENYRPVSVLPLLSKVFERLIYDQLIVYLEQYLNSLLCGFRKAHSTQHALFRLLQNWHNELDNSGFVGII